MSALSGYWAVGTLNSTGDVFVPANAMRPAFPGAAGDPQSLPPIPDITGPPTTITHGAVCDQAGTVLAYWDLMPLRVEVPGNFPPLDFTILLHNPALFATNATRATGDVSSMVIDRGRIFGTFNGQAIVAGCRLVIAGGQFYAKASFVRRAAAAA